MDVHFQQDHALKEILYNSKWTVGNSVILICDIF